MEKRSSNKYYNSDISANECLNVDYNIDYPPKLKMILIKIIGIENYRNVSYATKKILLKDAVKEFQRELIQKYGSLYNYSKEWAKNRGFKSLKEYTDSLYQVKGYNGKYDYENKRAIEMGYKSRWEKTFNRYKEKINAEKSEDIKNYWAKNRGFKNVANYKDYLSQKKGFKDNNHYKRFLYSKKPKKDRFRENIISQILNGSIL